MQPLLKLKTRPRFHPLALSLFEKLAKDKRSSLLDPFVGDEEKKQFHKIDYRSTPKPPCQESRTWIQLLRKGSWALMLTRSLVQSLRKNPVAAPSASSSEERTITATSAIK